MPISPTFLPFRAIPRLVFTFSMILILLSSIVSCAPQVGEIAQAKTSWHGIWVQARSLVSPEAIDEMLSRVEKGGFNAIFINVFLQGQTVYPSRLVRQYAKIQKGFDPLAYLLPRAHERGLEVHAWYVVGWVEDQSEDALLSRYPDWGLVGPDGETSRWLNFARPEVRQFIGDLMLETIETYGVDGIHFDYTRYPGDKWGFDPYTIEQFNRSHTFDLNELRYADLPAYGKFESNPLAIPTTAQVLARFENGYPAVTLNTFGKGQVLVLNWNATERTVAAGNEILQRALRSFDRGGRVYVLFSRANAAKYGDENEQLVYDWLNSLGWAPLEVGEYGISELSEQSVLVLPNVYLISEGVAQSLANFVSKGGHVIFIDGPTKSMKLGQLQAITGMQSRGSHFEEYLIMLPAESHPLIPASSRQPNLSEYQARREEWNTFRRQIVSTLIEEVSRRIKTTHPNVKVTITITSNQDDAHNRFMQDWQTWLQNDDVDYLIPRGYVDRIEELSAILEAWQPAIREYHAKILFGLRTYLDESGEKTPKPASQVLTEIHMTLAKSLPGYMIFDLENASDEQLTAIKNIMLTTEMP
jgi:uncharacterized lipoprotein YddW (UPF0748 family)